MTLSWVACEAKTGRVIERLPGLRCRQVGVTIGRQEAAQGVELPFATAPAGWERAVLEGATFLVLTDEPSLPLWGGIVLDAPRDGALEHVSLSVVTAEVYADMRFVGDETYTGVGQNEVIADLAEKYVMAGPNGGIPLTVVKLDGDGPPVDRAYLATSGQSVLSRWQELSASDGGPEFTIGWQHLSAPERYVPVLYVGSRIGASPAPGLRPAAVFTMPGNLRTARQARSYARGKGANYVTAWSSGQGGARPEQPHTVPDPDRPTFEHRFQPSANVTDDAALAGHARRKAEQMASGNRALTLVADYERAPRLGLVWSIGDDVAYRIGGPRDGIVSTVEPDVFADVFTDEYATAGVVRSEGSRETVPAFPGGLQGTARALGWRMTLDANPTISPILAGSEGGE